MSLLNRVKLISVGHSWDFLNLLLVIALEGIFIFLSLGFFLFVGFFFPNSPFFPLPLPVLPVSTSLALLGASSFPQAALTTSCSSAGGAVCAAEASFLLVH